MGLIDYLGRWNLNKRSEMYGKTFLAHFIRQNTDFSVKPPHEFADRFLKKIKRIFKVQEHKDPRKAAEQFEKGMMQDEKYFTYNNHDNNEMEEEYKSDDNNYEPEAIIDFK